MSGEVTATVSASPVVAALQKASAATGTGFDYLLKTAMRESGLKPGAKAATSSASGLFQFVEQTWMSMVKNYGGKYGLGSYASAIAKGGDGRYYAANAADRQAILNLRSDPQVSALMAGEFAAQSRGKMQSALGRPVGDGELYAAHFLGTDAACRLVQLNETAPGASAASAFPQAAEANRSVFYHADGSAKTVGEVYAWTTRQTQTPSIPSGAGTADPSPTVSREAMAVALSQFQTRMLASALLSEEGAGGETGSSSSPLQLSYGLIDVLAAAQAPRKTQT